MTKYTLLSVEQKEINIKAGAVKILKQIDNNKYLTDTSGVIVVTDKQLTKGSIITGKLIAEIAPFVKTYNMILCAK